MRRRTFVTLVGSAAVAWPLVARARDSSTSRRVGVLMNVTAGDAVGQSRLNAFQKAFQQLGWTDGGTSGSMCAGREAILSAVGNMRRN